MSQESNGVRFSLNEFKPVPSEVADHFREQHNIRLGEVCGRGGYGICYKAHNLTRSEPLVVKAVHTTRMGQLERDVLKRMRHPNLIRSYDIIEYHLPHRMAYTVMQPLEGGDLDQMLDGEKPIAEHIAQPLFSDIIAGLYHLHKKLRVCHRDIKSGNIMIHKGRAVLIDLSLVAPLEVAGGSRERLMLTSFVRDQAYETFSPEVLRGPSYSGRKLDIWSSGVVLFQMLNGFVPYTTSDSGDWRDLLRQQTAELYKQRFSKDVHLSSAVMALIALLLTFDPYDRPIIDHVISNAWIVTTPTGQRLNVPGGGS